MQGFNNARVNAHDVANKAHVVLFARVLVVQHFELLRAYQPAVASRQAHRFAAGLVDQPHNVLLHLAGQYPFHHFHGFVVGYPHALHELAFFAQAVQRRFNLRAAAMYHHRVHAHQL